MNRPASQLRESDDPRCAMCIDVKAAYCDECAVVVAQAHKSRRRPHVVRSRYVMLNVTCGRCGEPWEQPSLYPNDVGWVVCPHCNHPAETARAEADGRNITNERRYPG